MHQNMKNFYDQQDINNLKINLILSPVIDKDYPDITVKITTTLSNDSWDNTTILHEGFLTEKTKFEHEQELLRSFKISIELKNKNYIASPKTAISIDSFKIDDFEIVPNWTQLANYTNINNVSTPTSHLGFIGTWSLSIHEPFYRWHHRITGQGWLLKP